MWLCLQYCDQKQAHRILFRPEQIRHQILWQIYDIKHQQTCVTCHQTCITAVDFNQCLNCLKWLPADKVAAYRALTKMNIERIAIRTNHRNRK